MSCKIIAGDFKDNSIIPTGWKQEPSIAYGPLGLKTLKLKGNIQSIEVVNEENKKSFIGAAGWGLVGSIALGPLGLIAGALAGGNNKNVCFACTLIDGRKFMAISDPGMYQKIAALAFETQLSQPPVVSQQEPSLTTQPKFCTECGNKLTPSDKFCSGCGAKILL